MGTDACRWVNITMAIYKSSLVIASIGQWRRNKYENLKMRIEEEVLEV